MKRVSRMRATLALMALGGLIDLLCLDRLDCLRRDPCLDVAKVNARRARASQRCFRDYHALWHPHDGPAGW
jgi:hypothetical protein